MRPSHSLEVLQRSSSHRLMTLTNVLMRMMWLKLWSSMLSYMLQLKVAPLMRLEMLLLITWLIKERSIMNRILAFGLVSTVHKLPRNLWKVGSLTLILKVNRPLSFWRHFWHISKELWHSKVIWKKWVIAIIWEICFMWVISFHGLFKLQLKKVIELFLISCIEVIWSYLLSIFHERHYETLF